MDEMKIRTGFMKGIISKVVSSIAKKKLGSNVKVTLKEFGIEIDDKAFVHLSIDAEMDKFELEKFLVKKLGI